MKNPEFEVGKFYKCLKPDLGGDGVVGATYKLEFIGHYVSVFVDPDGKQSSLCTSEKHEDISALFVEVEEPIKEVECTLDGWAIKNIIEKINENKERTRTMIMGTDPAGPNESMMQRDGTDRVDAFDKPETPPISFARNESERIYCEELWARIKRRPIR